MDRRLPVFLVVDISDSRAETETALRAAVAHLVGAFRRDPYYLEVVHVCVVTFDGSARQVVPLTDVLSFDVDGVPLRGDGTGPALGAAIHLVTTYRDEQVRRASDEHRGDRDPLVFFVLGGHPPTDDVAAAAAVFKERPWATAACLVPSAAMADDARRLAETVLAYDPSFGSESLMNAVEAAWIEVSWKTWSDPISLSFRPYEPSTCAGEPLPPPPDDLVFDF